MCSMICDGHLEFMQIRKGCQGWKIGHLSFCDKLELKEHKYAIKFNVGKQVTQETTPTYTKMLISWCQARNLLALYIDCTVLTG